MASTLEKTHIFVDSQNLIHFLAVQFIVKCFMFESLYFGDIFTTLSCSMTFKMTVKISLSLTVCGLDVIFVVLLS